MSYPRKIMIKGNVLLVTSRMEEGLPMVMNRFMNLIIWSVLAKARLLYKAKVCHFLFMGNHFHMIVVVEEGEEVSNFIGYVKSEIAHAINQLLGRKKKTIWESGYDSPVLLTYEDVIRYVKYIYNNPVRANLLKSINHYKGVSSWNMFISGQEEKLCRIISRSAIFELEENLKKESIGRLEEKKVLEQLLLTSKKERGFKIFPDAWMDCFEETRDLTEEERQDLNRRIMEDIEKEEVELSRAREEKGEGVLGVERLSRKPIQESHTPKKGGCRMICLSMNKGLRSLFIQCYRSLCETARSIYEVCKAGEVKDYNNLDFPGGLFPPNLIFFQQTVEMRGYV